MSDQPFPDDSEARERAKVEWEDAHRAPGGEIVTQTAAGPWQINSEGEESRINIGRSEKGWHYQVELGEHEGRWSEPQPTKDLAEQAALDVRLAREPIEEPGLQPEAQAKSRPRLSM